MKNILKQVLIKKKEIINPLNKRIRMIEVIGLVVVAVIIGLFAGSAFTCLSLLESENNKANINKNLEEFSDVYESLSQGYYKDVDSDKLIDAAISGMLASLDDPYASYMDKEQKAQFDERMLGEYEGLGVELLSDTNNNVTIITIFDNSPAKKTGILVGDIIKEVDKKDATKMTSTEIANYIKDSKAKKFNIKVERNGTTYSYNIKKEKIELKSVTTKIFNTNNKKVGYIYISIFANNTYTQFRDALLDMEKNNIDSLVIDVRDNAGGYLHIANEMISLFLKKDSIVYQIETKGSIAKVYDHTEDYRTYPIAVLINKQSASASEILASALKDVYHSMIIGEASYGKGTVQQTEDLGNGAMIKYTIQKWLTPNGDWIDGKGVEPTTSITLDSKYQLEPTDANDNQLQKALELLTK